MLFHALHCTPFSQISQLNWFPLTLVGDTFGALQGGTGTSLVKCVILGQDPYYNSQATGLAFAAPIVQQNILKLLYKHHGYQIPQQEDLLGLAKQGFLVLNTVQTVEHGIPGSPGEMGWKLFTDAIIKAVSACHNVVFIFMGNDAQQKEKIINETSSNNLIIKTGHPKEHGLHGDASAFYKSRDIFTECNTYLKSCNKEEIDWHLVDSTQSS